MGGCLCDRLTSCFHNKPPLVIFITCLGGFAVVLLTLSYYVKVHNLTNPDISEDWNSFLNRVADVEFCVQDSTLASTIAPSTVSHTPVVPSSPNKLHELFRPKVNSSTDKAVEGFTNVTVSMLVEMRPTLEFLSIPHNVTHLTTTISGKQLGFSAVAADMQISLTFELPYKWDRTQCDVSGVCQMVNFLTCISFQAPESAFPPATLAKPYACSGSNESGIFYHTTMVGQKPAPVHNKMKCEGQPVIRVKHKLDPTLTMMLNLRDRSLINLHLMHTSYFLFVMVVTLFCYAIIRGHPLKVKVSQSTDKNGGFV